MKNLEILNPQTMRVYKAIFDNKKPILFMMQGLPASGKSTIAKQIQQEVKNTVIHSSDELRKELFGDENDQSGNDKLFIELHRRIKNDLRNGSNVIYDATNLSKKRRVTFLKELKGISCAAFSILAMTPYDECLRRAKARDRAVPEEVIQRMYFNWQPPHYSEGFEAILPVFCENYDYKRAYGVGDLIDRMMAFDQENSHHRLTLGEHCIQAYKYMEQYHPEDESLRVAALLHDIGKMATKTHYDKRGAYDIECHYYNHHCVGAYESIFYLWNYIGKDATDIDDILYVSNLIYYHMHPFMSWKQSEKSMNRDMDIIGAKMFRDICYLHDADLFAH